MKEIKHIWTVLCSNSSIDTQTNNMSLFNIVEKVEIRANSPSKIDPNLTKTVNFPFELVTLWRNYDSSKINNFNESVEFIGPDNSVIHSMDKEFEITKSSDWFRRVLQLDKVNITQSGNYMFRIKIKTKNGTYETVAEIPVQVSLL